MLYAIVAALCTLAAILVIVPHYYETKIDKIEASHKVEINAAFKYAERVHSEGVAAGVKYCRDNHHKDRPMTQD